MESKKSNPASLNIVRAALESAKDALSRLSANEKSLDEISCAAQMMTECLRSGGKIISCGNGGSHCDAMHFAEEMTGRFRDNRRPLAALAISDVSHITCTGNDFGFEHVFERFVLAHARPNDVLLALSTSGRSVNVIRAAEAARSSQAHVIALTGSIDCPLAKLASIHIATPAGIYADRVQELHIKILHIFIELIEKNLGT